MSEVLILGGDGYLGWPTAMRFSSLGHNVTVVDNYFRRTACLELDAGMLYPVPTLVERAGIWRDLTGRTIRVVVGDLTQPELIRGILRGGAACTWPHGSQVPGPPQTVIHYAEQPSAPYSLLSHHHANITLSNNLLVTNNLMFAVKDFCPETHIIKLGTMGEYGTPNIDIEEGWIEISHKGRQDRFLFPRQASSIYHTSKIMDTDLLWFGVRTWGLGVTDLMQGPVYGIDTRESAGDHRLRTIFNYDEVFGTVLNRFLVQAVAGYPLTVYGSGGQTRGYLNIRDTLQCVEAAAAKPAQPGELRIFNQVMETFSVIDLAKMVSSAGAACGYDVRVDHLENPRKEAEEHYYNPTYQGLLDLGVTPHLLTQEVLRDMLGVVAGHRENIRPDIIYKGVTW